MIYHYGLRVNEATALTLEDIDLKNHRIRLRRLTNGLGGEKPLWRHTAKQLRASRAGVAGTAGRDERELDWTFLSPSALFALGERIDELESPRRSRRRRGY